jgi:hypothetical protein
MIGLLLCGRTYTSIRNYDDARELATSIAERVGERIADGQRLA